MTITDLKATHNERIINMVVTDIVVAGIGRYSDICENPATPLGEDCKKCFEDIDGSSWEDIRSIIKRSL